jgi:transcriptional regulator with XRE-family HTH domain
MPSAPLGSPLYAAIVKALVEARQKAGIRQTELAEKLGKPQSFISKYEHGERILDVAEFVIVAQVLGADPCKLLADSIERHDHASS